ncbi:MAG: hypothetical protein IJS65_02435 [Clostridia bacterium]|nr:hypothetical protein [Clostridia bacterium]
MLTNPEKCFIFKVPEGLSFELFHGFKEGDAVKPDSEYTDDGFAYYSFTSIEPGNYRYTLSGKGFYSMLCSLYLSEKKLNEKTVYSVDPGKIAGNGFEPSDAVIRKYTDEVYENVAVSDDETWKELDPLFVTPSFSGNKARHEFTSQKELESFLKEHISAEKDSYLFVLAQTGKLNYDLPAVVFTKTDISACRDLKDAAEKVRNNGKITVHYQAQIHGNEPASGEAALMYIKKLVSDDAFRNNLLEKINLYVIPRMNPDGSEVFKRNESAQNINMNRDYLSVKTDEVKGSIMIAKAFDPFVIIDAHEYTVENANEEGPYNDVLMHTSGVINKGMDAVKSEADIMWSCFKELKKHGLRACGYPDLNGKGGGATIGGVNPVCASTYFGLNGAFGFLVESRGIYDGRFTWKRRLSAQHYTVGRIIDYAAENADHIRNTVFKERDRLVKTGSPDAPDTDFVLECVLSKDDSNALVWARQTFNLATGELLNDDKDYKLYYYDKAVRKRTCARKYYFPKGESFEEELRRLLSIHEIAFSETEENYKASVRQYTGSYESAELSDIKQVCFPKGAIIVPMDQINANFAAYLFEPDLTDSNNPTLPTACAGIIPCDNGVFPIYRV